jgi:REP element-mobilizing transposase RayT
LVWITKYRKEVLTEEIQEKLIEILEKTCEKI